MSSPKSPSGFPSESPELAAERARLIAELLKQSKTATGATQTVLRKLHDVLQQSRPGASVDARVYNEAKEAFELFGKQPGLIPPPIVGQVAQFLQKSAAAMKAPTPAKPTSNPPPPAPSAPPHGVPLPRRNTQDGFELPIKRTQSSVDLNPAVGLPVNKGAAAPQSGLPASQMKNPGGGKLKG